MGAHDASPLKSVLKRTRLNLGCSNVLVTMLIEGKQIVLSYGSDDAPDDWILALPMGHSICRHVADLKTTLVIEDAATHPLLEGNGNVAKLGVGAYVGVPIYLGSDIATILCAIDMEPRAWKTENIGLLKETAREAAGMFLADLDAPGSGLPITTHSTMP